MQEAAETFDGSFKGAQHQPDGHRPTREEQKTLADGVKLEASKIGLVWGSNAPSPAEAESLLMAFEERHSQFLTLMYMIGSGAGLTLIRFIKEVAAPVTASCIDLIEFLSSHDSVPEGQAAKKVGVVMEACDKASAVRLDNQHAFGRLFVVICRRVKDNARELRELVECGIHEDDESQEKDKTAGSLSDSGDLDFEQRGLTSSEHAVAKCAVKAIDAVVEICKRLLKVVLSEPLDDVEGWESLLFHAQKLGDASNDLGAALYAPQDKEEIAQISNSLQLCCELIVDELPEGNTNVQHQCHEVFLSFQAEVSEALAQLTSRLKQ